VGFSIARLAPHTTPTLVDFVLSCRVAQQRVEHAFLKWLAGQLRDRGHTRLAMTLSKTDRNAPLRQVFADLEFEILGDTPHTLELALDLTRPLGDRDLARIDAADAVAF
ncbi:MAG TPA: hypothetical protein VGJ29_08155, partial [Vicinamibacterales bacterium]